LSTIVTQAQRITQITRGLLTFSRPHALDIQGIPVGLVIETAISAVDGLLASSRVSVEKNLQRDLPRVLADEDSLVRVLENLFRNAIDAMPDGGALQIRAVKEGPSGVRLEVSDTGIGIEPDNLARIFDPFFTTKEVGKGTGLGLSIVHGIIREHNGTVTVTSKPGVGTKFVIILPAEH
jgi:signal transduction histidine kinase